jgi:hypothetical protein
MDKAVRSSSEQLTALVEQHVGEIELKEDGWNKTVLLEMSYVMHHLHLQCHHHPTTCCWFTSVSLTTCTISSSKQKRKFVEYTINNFEGDLNIPFSIFEGGGSSATAAGNTTSPATKRKGKGDATASSDADLVRSAKALHVGIGLRTPTVYNFTFYTIPLIAYLYSRTHERYASCAASRHWCSRC